MFNFLKNHKKIAFIATFCTTYDYMKKERHASTEEALKKAIEGFIYRAPFNILNKDDINWLTRTFATLPDPKILADVLSVIDENRDATGLKDRDKIFDFVTDLKKEQEAGRCRIS